jgi:hypothetical protein
MVRHQQDVKGIGMRIRITPAEQNGRFGYTWELIDEEGNLLLTGWELTHAEAQIAAGRALDQERQNDWS